MDRNKFAILGVVAFSVVGMLFTDNILDWLEFDSKKRIDRTAMKADCERVIEIANDSMKSGSERKEFLNMQVEYWDIIQHLK